MTLNAKTLIQLFRVPLKGQIWPRASNLTDPKKRTWHMHGMMGVYGCPKSSGAISQSIHQFPVFGFIIWAKGLDFGCKNSNTRQHSIHISLIASPNIIISHILSALVKNGNCHYVQFQMLTYKKNPMYFRKLCISK